MRTLLHVNRATRFGVSTLGAVAIPANDTGATPTPQLKWINVANEGEYKGHHQGEFALTPEVLQQLVDNLHNSPQYAAGKAAARAWKASRFAEGIAAELEHGMWLGALDAQYEGETGKAVQAETFSDLWHALILLKKGDPGVDVDPAFSKRPQIDAGKAFIEKEVVTPDIFAEMTKSAQRRAFTVANAATDEIARSVKRELVRQVATGADLRDFKKHALARLEQAGWTPQNASHAETVLRTNVMTAYNSGRYRQMTQPAVEAALPYWQILGVDDYPDRQRKTHHEAMNKVLPANDAWFKTAYPPFGFNCRCRVRALSKGQAERIGITSSGSMPDLPDQGFASGAAHLL